MSASFDQVLPAYDAAAMAELEEMFGRERLAELLVSLDKEIAARLDAPSGERDQLGRDAHALVSVSGMLGFAPLSQACTELEVACLDDANLPAALARVLAAADEAKIAIVGLRASLA